MGRSDDEYNEEEEEEEEEELDEDDQDVYEEEEEEEVTDKRKKSRLSYFIEEEAYDAGEDEEEEDEEDEAEPGWNENLHTETERERISRREVFSALDSNGQSEEELVRKFAQRAKERYQYDYMEDDEGLPKLSYWRLKCRFGEERHFVAMMMQKFLNTEVIPDSEEKVLIKTIIAPQHLPGCVYVEAERETHVKQAIKGMPGVFTNSPPMLVPLQDVIEILAASKKNIDLKPGSWVRVKLGKYKNDIGKVLSYDPARSRATVRIIPRVDYSEVSDQEPVKKKKDEDEDENGTSAKKPPIKRKRTRPQARLFNHDEVSRMFPSRISQRGNHREGISYIFLGETYVDGFLHKQFRLSSLTTDNVVPTFEELSKFQEKTESSKRKEYSDDEDEDDENPSDLSSTTRGILDSVIPSIAKKPLATFAKGDTVKVIEGDLKNLMGVVESVDEHSVTIQPIHEGIKDLLLFTDTELQKYFKIGDHVKVISGRYEGETGLVLRVEDITVVLLSDLSMSEIKVKIQDLQECAEISTGKLELGNYQLHDLVQTAGNRVGIIIKVERDSFKVLDENSSISTVRLQEIGNKRRADSTALDAYGNTVNVKDMVEVADGIFKGKQGTVLKIARNYLFLKGRDVFENGGVFVVRPNFTYLMGGSRNKQNPVPGGSMQRGGGGGRFGGGRGGGRGGRGGRGRDDSPLHKIVTVRSGNWKGYTGIVKECSDDMVQVELQTNSKKINLKLSEIILQEQRQTSSDYAYDQQQRELASKTPTYGDHGMSTPGRSSDPWSARHSDSHDSYSSSTPGSSYQSPYSPYTPNTPAEIHRGGGGSAYDQDRGSYGTPYDHRNMSTPSMGNMSTPSITNYDTPTPGSYSQGGYDQPTPSGHYDIPQSPYTPHNHPQTPMSEDVEDDSDQPNWKGTGIEVQFNSSSPVHPGKYAVVLENTTESTCKVQLLDNKEIVYNVSQDHLNLVRPEKKDRVTIVKGSYTGLFGQLHVLLGEIGVVKIDTNLDLKVFKISQLGKLITPE